MKKWQIKMAESDALNPQFQIVDGDSSSGNDRAKRVAVRISTRKYWKSIFP
jgi:hypothetical protein